MHKNNVYTFCQFILKYILKCFPGISKYSITNWWNPEIVFTRTDLKKNPWFVGEHEKKENQNKTEPQTQTKQTTKSNKHSFTIIKCLYSSDWSWSMIYKRHNKPLAHISLHTHKTKPNKTKSKQKQNKTKRVKKWKMTGH